MISFRSKSEIGASVAIVAALMALVVLGAYAIFDHGPSRKGIVNAGAKMQKSLQEQIADLEKNAKAQKAIVDAKVWTRPIQEIGPGALQTVTGFSKEARLKLAAFRPQKPNEVNGLTQLPFLISVEGSYLGVLSFVHKIETTDSKLALNLIQLSSTDGSSDQVNATIGVMAYTLPAPPEKSSPSDKSKEKVNAKKTN